MLPSYLEATRRWTVSPLFRGQSESLCLHRYRVSERITPVVWKGGPPMDILGLIAVLSFGLTCFGIGYSIGKDSNHTRK